MEDSFALLRCLVANVWNGLIQIQVPGLGISFAAFFIGFFLFSFSVWLIRYLFSLDKGGDSD